MRKGIGLICLILMLLIGCTNKIDFAEEKPFVKLELYSASLGTYLDHFPKNITVSNDGSVQLYTEEVIDWRGKVELKVEEDAPIVKKEISAEKVEEIKDIIEKNDFYSIPRDVTDHGVMDGGGSKITVYEKNHERTVGGENSGNEQYNEIKEIIFDQVREEYSEWEEETKEYLFELNE